MTRLEVSIHVLPSKRREFLHVLEAFSSEERSVNGCLSVDAWEEHAVPNHFLWLECWDQETLVEQRIASDGFRALIGAIKVLGELESIKVARVQKKHDPIARKSMNRFGEVRHD